MYEQEDDVQQCISKFGLLFLEQHIFLYDKFIQLLTTPNSYLQIQVQPINVRWEGMCIGIYFYQFGLYIILIICQNYNCICSMISQHNLIFGISSSNQYQENITIVLRNRQKIYQLNPEGCLHISLNVLQYSKISLCFVDLPCALQQPLITLQHYVYEVSSFTYSKNYSVE